MNKLSPQVADLYVFHILGIHYHALLGLCEAEDEQYQTNDSVDSHGHKPCTAGLWGIDDCLSVSSLWGKESNNKGNT